MYAGCMELSQRMPVQSLGASSILVLVLMVVGSAPGTSVIALTVLYMSSSLVSMWSLSVHGHTSVCLVIASMLVGTALVGLVNGHNSHSSQLGRHSTSLALVAIITVVVGVMSTCGVVQMDQVNAGTLIAQPTLLLEPLLGMTNLSSMVVLLVLVGCALIACTRNQGLGRMGAVGQGITSLIATYDLVLTGLAIGLAAAPQGTRALVSWFSANGSRTSDAVSGRENSYACGGAPSNALGADSSSHSITHSCYTWTFLLAELLTLCVLSTIYSQYTALALVTVTLLLGILTVTTKLQYIS